MPSRSWISVTSAQREELRALAGSSDREEADRARAMLLSVAGWTSAHRGGVLRAAGQRAALALDSWPGGDGRVARRQGAGPGSGQGRRRVARDRGVVGAGGVGAAKLDLAPPGRCDRAADRAALIAIAPQRGDEKGGLAWRRPRHTLTGRQDAAAVDRSGLRLRLLRQQARAGDIVRLFGDESEALTHPYLARARAWARRGADLRVQAPGQARLRALLGFLDCAAHKLIINTSATKRSTDFIAALGRRDTIYRPCPGRPEKPVTLVLDNGPIHTSKASRAALAERAWLTLQWLPNGCPNTPRS